jgi:hypothetical protein
MNTELFEAIESPALSAQVNVVSGYNQFVRALVSLPEVRSLLDEVKLHDGAKELLARVLTLLRAPYDPAYENPHDMALAAYLWVLNAADPEKAQEAGKHVLGCPGCWWAAKLAENLTATTNRSGNQAEQPSPNGEAASV